MAPPASPEELAGAENPEKVITDLTRSVDSKTLLSDVALGATLGLGTYGRVRLAESPNLTEDIRSHGVDFSGSFAIKILKKSEILRLKQADHVKSEYGLLLHKINHPFIVKAYGAYKDERTLCMIMEYVPGGEVLAQCRAKEKNLPNEEGKFYAAQLVMALQYLHADHIVYRGVVPDNILIDKAGYIKLVDFGFAKKLKSTDGQEAMTYTLCGTAEYLAPEIVNSKGHGKGADWWALGIVIYEMLAGYPPFYAPNPFDIYQAILKAQPPYPGHFDANLHDSPGHPGGLLTRLLHADRNKRIGCLKNGAEDIKKHKWFRGLNWAALYNKQMAIPGGPPTLSSDSDHSYFPKYPDSVEESGPLLDAQKQSMFEYWGSFSAKD